MSDFTTSAKPVLSLHYFPLLARGLGPTLCMEFSGIPYTGNADSEKIDYKTISPFGQMPVMQFKDEKIPPMSQTIAIINTIGNLAKTDGSDSLSLYTYSNQLMYEAEDLYQLMVKYVPTSSRPLSDPAKGSIEDYNNYIAVLVPKHMAMLEKMISLNVNDRVKPWTNGVFTTGELFLFSMLYQMTLVSPTCLETFPNTKKMFDTILNHQKTKCVLEGKSCMGTLNQYFFKHE